VKDVLLRGTLPKYSGRHADRSVRGAAEHERDVLRSCYAALPRPRRPTRICQSLQRCYQVVGGYSYPGTGTDHGRDHLESEPERKTGHVWTTGFVVQVRG